MSDKTEQETDRRPGADAFVSMGSLIGLGAAGGLIVGTMLGGQWLALALAAGAGLGTVAGAVLESRRSRTRDTADDR